MKNLTVCIIFITVISSFLLIDNYKDFLSIFCCLVISYILGVFFVKCVLFYIRKKRTENLVKDIEQLLGKRFLFKIKNKLQKISDKQLHTD